MNALRRRWQSVSIRERALLTICALSIALWLGHYLIWPPWQQRDAQWRLMAERERQTANWLQQQAPRIQQAAGRAPARDESALGLSALAARSASRHGLNIIRLQPQGRQVSVTLAPSDFNALIRWLSELEGDAVTTPTLEVSAIPAEPGRVTVGKLLLERTDAG
ncbi:type II secretion system protein M [Brenneria goodwinii]|uniref:type II secretion system protein GspM n=1 Tax=Brenneria goodwinii TaxID=1109412 RepID=UPI0036DFC27E